MHIKKRNKHNLIYYGHVKSRTNRGKSALTIIKYLMIFILVLLFLKVMFTLVVHIIHSDVFAVSGKSNIVVTDLNYLKEQRVYDAINFDSASIFVVNIRELRRQVETAIPQAQAVSVWREWPNKIMINVKERQPVGIVVSDGQSYGVDDNFVVFPLVDSYKLVDEPIITGLKLGSFDMGRRIDNINLIEAVTILVYIEKNTKYLVNALDEIDVSDLDKIVIYLNDGSAILKIFINNEKESEKIDYAERTYRLYLDGKIKIKRYIDVRFWSPFKKDVVIY